jgi:uncharacterized protein (DUF1697 family)
MSRYVGLLRGINVGGKHSVPMADLRLVFESLACSEVATLIQSGNVVFSAAKPLRPESVERALATHFGFGIPVVLREASELARIVGANPFGAVEPTHLHVGFLAKRPTASAASGFDARAYLPEEFVLRGAEVYFHLPDGMGRAKLPANLDRHLKIPTTIRNWNTVTKLMELAGG